MGLFAPRSTAESISCAESVSKGGIALEILGGGYQLDLPLRAARPETSATLVSSRGAELNLCLEFLKEGETTLNEHCSLESLGYTIISDLSIFDLEDNWLLRRRRLCLHYC